MNLETQIYNFIRLHKNGVLISEIEQNLGINRMRIGFATNNLLHEGKLKKIDNKYFIILDEGRQSNFILRDDN